MGLCSREQISKKLKESDCFVLASQSETFGRGLYRNNGYGSSSYSY